MQTRSLIVLYSLREIITTKQSWSIHVARMAGRKKSCTFLIGNPEAQRQHGRPRHELEDNIKMDKMAGCVLGSSRSR
jgi:hypothetical protein